MPTTPAGHAAVAAFALLIPHRPFLGRRRSRRGRRLSSARARSVSSQMYSEHLRASALSMLSNGVERSKVRSSIGVSRTQLKR